MQKMSWLTSDLDLPALEDKIVQSAVAELH